MDPTSADVSRHMMVSAARLVNPEIRKTRQNLPNVSVTGKLASKILIGTLKTFEFDFGQFMFKQS